MADGFDLTKDVVITAEVVLSLETAKGGYRPRAIAFITGGDIKPPSGWKQRHIGEVRSRRKYIDLLNLESSMDEQDLFKTPNQERKLAERRREIQRMNRGQPPELPPITSQSHRARIDAIKAQLPDINPPPYGKRV